MDEPLDKRLQELISRLSRGIERVAQLSAGREAEPARAPAAAGGDLAGHVRAALRLYDQHRDQLDPAGRERLLEFVADDLVGLARAHAPAPPPAAAPAPGAGAEEAMPAAAGLRLLVEAGAALAGSLEYEAALDRLARLCAASFAEVCAVHLLEGEGRVRLVSAVHRDAAGQLGLAGIGALPFALDHPCHPVAAVLRSGLPARLADASPSCLRRLAAEGGLEEDGDGEVAALGPVLVEPLASRGQLLGAIGFARRRGRPAFSADDVALARELARRAALAVEHARVRAEAEQARRVRADFVGSISHEFRTPLMTVTAFAHLLQDGIPEPIPERAREHVRHILSAAGHLDRLVETALGFGRSETGWAVVHPRSVELAALARETAELVEPLARQKGLGFVVEAEGGPCTVRTDPDKVRQILFNLLGNAVKFTERGGIRVAVRDEGERCVVEVADTGIGIPPEHLEQAFEPFWQAEPGSGARGPGIGLGLALVRRLAWSLGAEVRAESEPGRGSVFRLVIPRS